MEVTVYIDPDDVLRDIDTSDLIVELKSRAPQMSGRDRAELMSIGSDELTINELAETAYLALRGTNVPPIVSELIGEITGRIM